MSRDYIIELIDRARPTRYDDALRAEQQNGIRATLPGFCQQGLGLLKTECDACYTDQFITRGDVYFDRVRYANVYDFIMLALCTFLVGHAVIKERGEIRAVRFLIFYELTEKKNPNWFWLNCYGELMNFRDLCLLPLVIATVPIFALALGMDALNIALNALAVLFILEVDNSMFSVALTERQKGYFASVEIKTHSLYKRFVQRAQPTDMAITFAAVGFGILFNHFIARGGGTGVNPTATVLLNVLLAYDIGVFIAFASEEFSFPKGERSPREYMFKNLMATFFIAIFCTIHTMLAFFFFVSTFNS